MKLSAYIVKIDSGFAPNPFGGYCTLACCKPVIRRCAAVGDIIVGTAPSHYPRAGGLIYAMRVERVLKIQEYWNAKEFAFRQPNAGSRIGRRGDNIWHRGTGGWSLAPHAAHGPQDEERDTNGENVLVSTNFVYYGRNAIPIHPDFAGLIAKTQGHKNTSDQKIIDRFWHWLSRETQTKGLLGEPTEFDEAACTHRPDIVGDEVEEGC